MVKKFILSGPKYLQNLMLLDRIMLQASSQTVESSE